MTAERQQFSLALGLSVAVNLLLVLLIVWSMAVTAGLTRHPAHQIPVPAAAAVGLALSDVTATLSSSSTRTVTVFDWIDTLAAPLS